MKIGVLAVQGGFAEHVNVLTRLGIHTVLIKNDLLDIDGLIIPGGESTVIGKLLAEYNMIEKLCNFSKPIWGTCAGLILLCDSVVGLKKEFVVGGISATVTRNGYGRQLDSFVKKVSVVGVGVLDGVFIRAPVLTRDSCGKEVEIIGTLFGEEDQVVAVKQGNRIGTCFHPELTNDASFHEYFIDLCKKNCMH